MRHRVLRGSLGSVAFVGLSAVAAVVFAKGYVNSTLSEADEDGTEDATTAFHEAMLVCAPQPPGECQDPGYYVSPCGKREASRMRRGLSSVCDATCDAELAGITVADCQDEAWLNTLCGQREQGRIDIVEEPPCTPSCPAHPSDCVNLLRAAEEANQTTFNSVMPGLPEREVVIPDTSSPDGYGPNIEKREIPVNDESGDGLYSGGTGRHYWSHGTAEAVTRRGGAVDLLSDMMIDQRHQRWDANGVALGTQSHFNYAEGCREYIYEKYYDYSRFEDEARQQGDSARARFAAAFDTADQPWAIGTRAIGDIPLRRKDGDANINQVQFDGEERHKNTMFYVEVHESAAARNDRLTKWRNLPDSDSNGVHEYVLPFGDTQITVPLPRPFSAKIFIVNDEIDGILREGRRPPYRYNEDWRWHRDTGTALLDSYLDEELHALERLNERMRFLLLQRSQLYRAYIDLLLDMIGINEPPPFLVEEGVGFDPNEQAGNPFAQFFADQHGLMAIAADGAGIDASFGAGSAGLGSLAVSTAAQEQQAMYGTFSGFGLHAALAGRMSSLTTASSTTIDPSNLPVTITSPALVMLENLRDAMLEVVAQDARIEALLSAAQARGCLSLGTNPCDWSPRLFAQRVEDPFMGAREVEYQRCLDFTSSTGFSAVPNVDDTRFYVNVGDVREYAVVDDGLTDTGECRAGAYNIDTDWVERYMACNLRYRQAIIDALNAELENGGAVVDPETGLLNISEETSDGDSFGNDVFNLEYSYGATWSVSGLPEPTTAPDIPEYCSLKPHLSGHFWTSAYVLIAEVPFIDASGNVGLDPEKPDPQAHLTVVGQELIDIDPESGDRNPYSFNVVAEETKEDGGEIFSIGATFVIVVVPVSIKGGLAGRVGAVAQLAAGSNGGGAATCEQGGMILRAQFEPFVGLDAFASASIDAVIVEAGVKITVTIAQVSFPFTTDLKFTGKPNGDALDVVLDGSTSLAVVFSFLGGRFSAFVEVCFVFCEEFEETLFEWAGLVFKTTLLETHFEVPLIPLMEYQQGNG